MTAEHVARITSNALRTHACPDQAENWDPTEIQRVFRCNLELSDPRISAQSQTLDYIGGFFLSGVQIGKCGYGVYRTDSRVSIHEFYPLLHATQMQRLGIGTLAHASSLLALGASCRGIGDYEVDHGIFISGDFTRLLYQMGINPRDEIHFSEYARRSVQYACSRGFRL